MHIRRSSNQHVLRRLPCDKMRDGANPVPSVPLCPCACASVCVFACAVACQCAGAQCVLFCLCDASEISEPLRPCDCLCAYVLWRSNCTHLLQQTFRHVTAWLLQCLAEVTQESELSRHFRSFHGSEAGWLVRGFRLCPASGRPKVRSSAGDCCIKQNISLRGEGAIPLQSAEGLRRQERELRGVRIQVPRLPLPDGFKLREDC